MRSGQRGAGEPPRGRPLRVLLSEGASTSARQTVTALGLAGHHAEVMDPGRLALARFSRFVRRFHRCPPMGTDPEGYRDFVLGLVAGGGYDVLLPIHEQGYLLARIADRLAPHVAVALPAFESYARAVSRIGFGDLLAELGIAQPRTEVVGSIEDLSGAAQPPCIIKGEVGTASRAVWIAADRTGLALAADEIAQAGDPGPLLVQELVEGPVEHAQAVFERGRLVAVHAYRQLMRGAGGGPALKESVDPRPAGRDLARIGAALDWHGALSVDYILRAEDGAAVYIDCNPRLVEPMSGLVAGMDLVDALLRVSTGEETLARPPGREGVRTRLAIQVAMGLGLRGASRREILSESWRASSARGPYVDSREELTPLRLDRPSIVPLAGTLAALTISPGLAEPLARRGWGTHLLTREATRRIAGWPR